jgi:hypothetical protein
MYVLGNFMSPIAHFCKNCTLSKMKRHHIVGSLFLRGIEENKKIPHLILGGCVKEKV